MWLMRIDARNGEICSQCSIDPLQFSHKIDTPPLQKAKALHLTSLVCYLLSSPSLHRIGPVWLLNGILGAVIHQLVDKRHPIGLIKTTRRSSSAETKVLAKGVTLNSITVEAIDIKTKTRRPSQSSTPTRKISITPPPCHPTIIQIQSDPPPQFAL